MLMVVLLLRIAAKPAMRTCGGAGTATMRC